MPTEVWFRNPDNYMREVVEAGATKVVWDRGYTYKKRIDIVRHAEMYFGKSIPYRLLHVGPQGTAEYRSGDALGKPCAVYPTWMYGDDLATLEVLMQTNVADAPTDDSVPADERPIVGQEHRVVIADVPDATKGATRAFLRQLRELQDEFPDCILHMHGFYSFRFAFGMGWRSADCEPRTNARMGKVVLPNAKEMKWERVVNCPQWVTLLGFMPKDLEVPRNRCIYNIKSAMWAGEHYDENLKFKSRDRAATGRALPDITSPNPSPATTKSVHSGKAGEGDKFLCDTCSLQTSCKYYRSGGVCSIPGSEPASLSRLFKTRDSSLIIEGLGTLMAANAARLERGMEDEEDSGELDPEVSKIIKHMMDGGIKLAKLVDPALAAAGATKVGVFVGAGGTAQVGQATPQSLVAAAVAELEARGIPRDKITPELLEGILNPDAPRSRAAIDATVVEHHSDT